LAEPNDSSIRFGFAMTFSALTNGDYDQKLREMGNYLWDLEQRADIASAAGHQTLVQELEAKILRQAVRAHDFFQIAGSHRVLAAFVAGLGFRMTRHWQQAAEHFQCVVQLSPMNGEAWLELTWCFAESGRWRECEMAARKSVEIFPKTAASWGNLAMALAKLGKTEEARESIRRAIQLDPTDPRNRAIEDQIGQPQT
jgi:tetratricopeptide (TPR) repeat protein